MQKIVTGNHLKDQSDCPFGQEFQKYWDHRSDYFRCFDEGIQMDRESLYSVTPEDIAYHIAQKTHGTIILDGFCGIGGNAIGFARSGKEVIAVDIDAEKLEMAKHNAAIYGVTASIRFIQGNILDILGTVEADVAYFDPPWGGPDYSKKSTFSLSHFQPDGRTLLALSQKNIGKTIFKVPRNIDKEGLQNLPIPFTLHEEMLHGKHIFSTVYFGT